MGYNEMDKVWDKSQATKTDKLVLLAIARRYKPGLGAWPSQKYLAKICGVDKRSISNSINRLEALGELTWIRGNNLSKKANLYFITVLESAKTSTISDAKTSTKVAKASPILSKNFPLLNKELNKALEGENSTVSETCLSVDVRVWAEQVNPGVDVDKVFQKFLLHPSHAQTDFLNRFKTWIINERPSATKEEDGDDWVERARAKYEQQ
jgi:DNA-binding MarR family transcriptional regulator